MSELEFEYSRYNTLKTIKKNFLQNCGLSINEAIKVWANWVIVNRTRERQVDEFLPTENLELDNKTVSLLIEKGIDEEEAINFYGNFLQQCQRWKYRLDYYKSGRLDPYNGQDDHAVIITSTIDLTKKPQIQTNLAHPDQGQAGGQDQGQGQDPSKGEAPSKGQDGTSDQISLEGVLGFSLDDNIEGNPEILVDYRGISHRIDLSSLYRLVKSYRGNRPRFSIWKLLNTYSLLDGLSYQWSLPPETFNLLVTNSNLRTELFASPLNHHVPEYYSLFEIDREFGSKGDLFSSNINEFKNGGFYEANPPFIESIFVRTSQIILMALQNSSKEIDLGFIFIMPDWLDSFAYKRFKTSEYLHDEIVLKKTQHKYWEYRKNRLIQANFNTHVLILTSNLDYYTKIWSGRIREEFIRSMNL